MTSAREYSKNLFAKWIDDDWLNQPRFDKLFWEALNGQRTTNQIGVFPINFTRWRKVMRDGDQLATDLELKAALIRMHRRRYVFIDEDTGEGLIRSRMRRDEIDKQPNPMLAALRSLAALDSPRFAVVMLTELDRINLPTIDKTSDAANRLRDNLKRAWDDARTHLVTLAEGLPEPLPEPFAEDFTEGLPEPLPEPLPRPGKTPTTPEPFREPFSTEGPVSVSGSVSVSNSPWQGGQVGEVGRPPTGNGEPHPTPGRTDPLPDRCTKHAHNPEPPPCGGCRAAREQRERLEAEQPEREAQRRADFWTNVANCPHCDDRGLIDDDATNRVHRCPNHDWETTHA